MGAVAASCLGGVLGLRQEVGFRPDSRPHFFCVAKRNGGKKRRALQAACPAELPSLLRRSGQTGSRKSDFFMSKHASLTAGVRGGTSAVPCTPSPACGRGLGRGLHFTHSPAGGRRGWGRCCFLFGRCAWFEAGGRVSARQPTPFLLRRQKKWGKEKASLAGGLSG